MNSPSRKKYIDGLRGLSVIAVIFYHAQFLYKDNVFVSKLGYLGVDIFFVISGYVITNLIIQNHSLFNLKNFYLRRTTRLLPLYLFIILISLFFGFFFLFPYGFVELAESSSFAIFFTSNFYFYFVNTIYAAESSLLKPLLHTWSLSVEAQFYIIYPILFILIYNKNINFFVRIIVFFFILSFFIFLYLNIVNHDLAFYSSLARMWEILAGCILGIYHYKYHKLKIKYNNIISILSLFLITLFLFLINFQINKVFAVSLIVILTIILIHTSEKKNLTNKILSNFFLNFIGKISYGLYLWHYPIFAFSRIAYGQLTNFDKLIILFFTFIISCITFILIEKKFHNNLKNLYNFKITILTLFLFVFFISILVKFFDGFPNRSINKPNIILNNFERDNSKLRNEHTKLFNSSGGYDRKFNEHNINVLIIGNSHAVDTFNILYGSKNLLPGYDFQIAKDVRQISCFDNKIKDFTKYTDLFKSSQNFKLADIVIISSRYVHEIQCDIEIHSQTRGSDFHGLNALIDMLKKNNKKVIVLGNSPEFKKKEGKEIADYYFDLYLKTNHDFDDLKNESEIFAFKHRWSEKFLITKEIKKIALKKNVNFFPKENYRCPELNKCLIFTDRNEKIYWDYGHLTKQGAQFFAKILFNNKEFLELLYINK